MHENIAFWVRLRIREFCERSVQHRCEPGNLNARQAHANEYAGLFQHPQSTRAHGRLDEIKDIPLIGTFRVGSLKYSIGPRPPERAPLPRFHGAGPSGFATYYHRNIRWEKALRITNWTEDKRATTQPTATRPRCASRLFQGATGEIY